MPIPTFDALMLPVLKRCSEQTWVMKDLITRIADDLGLTAEERAQQIPSNSAPLIASRVHWAKTFLKQAALLDQPKRGIVKISELGQSVLAKNPTKTDVQFLHQFPDFLAFQNRTKAKGNKETPDTIILPDEPTSSETPEEQIVVASNALDESLKDALLARILDGTPEFFERLILDLLLAMGYGGSRTDAGEQLGKTGDGGVDGVIREDQLGLDRVYLQAKCYKPDNTVGGPAVQAFMGALIGKGAHKGVLITTSNFSKAAINVAEQSGNLRIVLIDGDTLTDLMIRFNVGVRVARSIDIKRIDLDYFGNGAEAE
jgi:restriction system protein